MYSEEDVRIAKLRVRMGALAMAAVLIPLLAVYVAAILKGRPGIMLAVSLAGLIWTVFAGDMWLFPELRYMRFLKDMQGGLRRSILCIPEKIGKEACMQDGVWVRRLDVLTVDEGEERIFYLNVSKLMFMPEMGEKVKLVSFGRHVVEWEKYGC